MRSAFPCLARLDQQVLHLPAWPFVLCRGRRTPWFVLISHLHFFFLDCSFVAFFCSTSVIENVTQATFKVKLDEDNVAGVHLPIFKNYADISNLRTASSSPSSPSLRDPATHPRQTAHLTSLPSFFFFFLLSSSTLASAWWRSTSCSEGAARSRQGWSAGAGGPRDLHQGPRRPRRTGLTPGPSPLHIEPHSTAHSRSAAL